MDDETTSTLGEQLENATALISRLGKQYSIKHDVVYSIFATLLNYDITLKQMEMSGFRPEGAKIISPEELKARMEKATAEAAAQE